MIRKTIFYHFIIKRCRVPLQKIIVPAENIKDAAGHIRASAKYGLVKAEDPPYGRDKKRRGNAAPFFADCYALILFFLFFFFGGG